MVQGARRARSLQCVVLPDCSADQHAAVEGSVFCSFEHRGMHQRTPDSRRPERWLASVPEIVRRTCRRVVCVHLRNGWDSRLLPGVDARCVRERPRGRDCKKRKTCPLAEDWRGGSVDWIDLAVVRRWRRRLLLPIRESGQESCWLALTGTAYFRTTDSSGRERRRPRRRG